MHVEEGQVLPGRSLPASGDCRWIISLDYDDTLRSPLPGQPVPKVFFDLMAEWHPLGVRWGINTGRSLPYLCQELLPCAPFLPDFICTCERFAYVADGNGQLSPLRAYNARCHEDNLRVRERVLPSWKRQLDKLRTQCPELKWVVAADDPLSLEAEDSSTMDVIATFLSPFVSGQEGIAVQRAGRYMRLADSRYCKGTVLHTIAQLWKVPPTRWAMIGDGHNDLHAFKLFPQAFCAAPSTAHPDVTVYLKEQGGYVSQTPGVMEILRVWQRLRMTA